MGVRSWFKKWVSGGGFVLVPRGGDLRHHLDHQFTRLRMHNSTLQYLTNKQLDEMRRDTMGAIEDLRKAVDESVAGMATAAEGMTDAAHDINIAVAVMKDKAEQHEDPELEQMAQRLEEGHTRLQNAANELTRTVRSVEGAGDGVPVEPIAQPVPDETPTPVVVDQTGDPAQSGAGNPVAPIVPITPADGDPGDENVEPVELPPADVDIAPTEG